MYRRVRRVSRRARNVNAYVLIFPCYTREHDGVDGRKGRHRGRRRYGSDSSVAILFLLVRNFRGVVDLLVELFRGVVFLRQVYE